MTSEETEDSIIQALHSAYSDTVPLLTQHSIHSCLIVAGKHNMYSFGTIDGPTTLFRMLWTLNDFLHQKARKSKDEPTARQLSRIQSSIEDCMEEDEVLLLSRGPRELTQQPIPSLKKEDPK